ncbi:MAG TPA: c-type cytochrome [Gemmatimonas sp.]|nr:c-type cytochrome [Gemmatimonas sp.]
MSAAGARAGARVMVLALGVVVVLAIVLLARARSARESLMGARVTPGAVTGLAPLSPSEHRGLSLLAAFRDSLPANSGNDLRCTSCHLENGTRATAMSWHGVASRYPRYRARRGSEENLTQRINECIVRSLAGRPLPDTSNAMRDMLAFFETTRDLPRPPAVDTVKLAGSAGNGELVYGAQCARCHGGQGGGLSAPAVWGSASYSVGAGMSRQSVLATFVRHNMPQDRAGTLTAEQAADVAAYILQQPRQDFVGKELDWPKGDPPADVAYPTDAAGLAGREQPPLRPLLPRRLP